MSNKYSKDDVFNAFDDICRIFAFETEIDVETATSKQIIEFLRKIQSDDDSKFIDDDFDPINFKDGLDVSTVELLIHFQIPIPESWLGKLKKFKSKQIKNNEEQKSKNKNESSKLEQKTNFLGHRPGSQSFELDSLMMNYADGFYIDDLIKIGWKKERVKSHLNYLKNKKGGLVEITKETTEQGERWKVTAK